jgi:hypothetical protein
VIERRAAVEPVTVRGNVASDLHRWKWLIKWLLAVPHLVLLIGLWIALVFATIAAGVVIAVRGRYPRNLFDFNVGVLRWTWRVNFYAFTLATDRYPPFSLDPDPAYPADLHVDYPDRLSRRLVWVKWWLLAIPHYVIVSIFAGGPSGGIGLIGIMAIVAGVIVASGRRYPVDIFDFVMGMHRWGWRVAAYGLLMTDQYPPFRLDMGGEESRPAAPATKETP